MKKKYFINENDTIEKLPESCSEISLNKSQIFTQNLTLSEINKDSGIIYPYIICGVTVTVTGVMFYILHCQNVLNKIGEQNASFEDKREDTPLNAILVCFFAAVIISLFGIQVKCGSKLSQIRPRSTGIKSIDISFNSQIYTYARCIGISMSQSSQLTSVFWFAYGASRIVGIFGSKYLIPRNYILLAMTGKPT